MVNESSAEARAMVVRSARRKFWVTYEICSCSIWRRRHIRVIITILTCWGLSLTQMLRKRLSNILKTRPPLSSHNIRINGFGKSKGWLSDWYIIDYLQDEGWYRFKRCGSGMGAVQTVEAAEYLIGVLKDYSKHAPQVHRAALLALANCVKWLPEVEQRKAMFAILPYLEHPTSNVRRTAVSALGKLPAMAFIDRLSARILFCEQDQLWLNGNMSIRKWNHRTMWMHCERELNDWKQS